MSNLQDSASEFLAARRIAVVGVSRDPGQTANAIFRKLKSQGIALVPVNPRAAEVEGVACYPDLKSIPGGVEAVLVVTPVKAVLEVVKQCRELAVPRVWIHGALGTGSVPAEAVDFCRRNGIRVIAGACPMMYCRDADGFHRLMRRVLGWLHRLPAGA